MNKWSECVKSNTIFEKNVLPFLKNHIMELFVVQFHSHLFEIIFSGSVYGDSVDQRTAALSGWLCGDSVDQSTASLSGWLCGDSVDQSTATTQLISLRRRLS